MDTSFFFKDLHLLYIKFNPVISQSTISTIIGSPEVSR